jgi:hypothetical protein
LVQDGDEPSWVVLDLLPHVVCGSGFRGKPPSLCLRLDQRERGSDWHALSGCISAVERLALSGSDFPPTASGAWLKTNFVPYKIGGIQHRVNTFLDPTFADQSNTYRAA